MKCFKLTLALALLVFQASCTSPGQGYRSTEVDPDLRLIELLDVYQGTPPTPACPECGSEEGHPCNAACRFFQDHGHVVLDPERARVSIERLHVEYPRHVPTLFANASIAFEAGEREKAASYLDALFAQQEVHADAAVLRSRIAIYHGNLPAARRLLEQQIRFTPDHAALQEALACTTFLDGKYDEALSALGLAERLGAPLWRIEYSRGLIAEEQDELMRAMRHYERALAENGNCSLAEARLNGLRAVAGEAVR